MPIGALDRLVSTQIDALNTARAERHYNRERAVLMESYQGSSGSEFSHSDCPEVPSLRKYHQAMVERYEMDNEIAAAAELD